MTTSGESGRRQRGRPAIVDRTRIVAAARTLPPDELTMQAVADLLGVDRKTLNYHVSGRLGLLELVAADVFAEAMSELSLVGARSWQEAVRTYADGVRLGVARLEVLAPHLLLQPASAQVTLTPADQVIRRLLDEGFAPLDVARAVRLVSALATASGREAARLRTGAPPMNSVDRSDHTGVVHGTVGALAGFRELAAADASPPDPGQWDFDLSVCIAGMAQLPTTRRGSPEIRG